MIKLLNYCWHVLVLWKHVFKLDGTLSLRSSTSSENRRDLFVE